MTEQPVALREATREDAGPISSLLEEAFREFEAFYTADAFAATALPEAGVRDRLEQGPVWVAERAGELVGTAAAVRTKDHLLLRGMAVRSSARGAGVGRMLLGRVEQFAREQALPRVFLYTAPFLKQAIRLYQAAGFRFKGDLRDLHGVALLRMEKETGAGGNRRLVEQVFRDANFIQSLGIELSAFGFGWCESKLKVSPSHFQQHEFVHAGVLMTLVDHTCGGAAASAAPEGKDVITVENKVSFLRPGLGSILRCRADVLRAGKTMIFTEGTVTAERADGQVIVAKASSTLAVIDMKPG